LPAARQKLNKAERVCKTKELVFMTMIVPYGQQAIEKFSKAVASSDRLLHDRDWVERLVTETDARTPELRDKLKDATQRLDNEASSESASVTELRAARKAKGEILEEIEVAEARVRGLKAKLSGFDENLIEAGFVVAAAESEFRQAVLAEFRSAAFLPAVAAFREMIEQGMAVMNGLGLADVTEKLLAVEIVDIEGGRQYLLKDLRSTSFNCPEGGGVLKQQHESWQASPEKVLLFDTYRALREPVGRLKGVAKRAIERRPVPIEAPRAIITVLPETGSDSQPSEERADADSSIPEHTRRALAMRVGR
jgi:hypothetical protein